MGKQNNRFLFLTHVRLGSTVTGGDQRTNLLHRALRTCGTVETLLLERYGSVPVDEIEICKNEFGLVGVISLLKPTDLWPWKLVRRLARRPVDVLARALEDRSRYYTPDIRAAAWLAHRLKHCRYDAIIGRGLSAAAMAGAFNYQPVLIDADDLEAQVMRTNLTAPNTSLLRQAVFRKHLRTLEKMTQRCYARCEHVWVAAEIDRDEVGYNRSSLLPNIPFVTPNELPIPHTGSSKSCQVVLIVASLAHRPNVEGVDWFVARIWPRIYKAYPQAALRIVGNSMDEKQRKRWKQAPGVQPAGFVADLKQEYAQCAFTVCPVFIGGGSKIKVIESLSNRRTSVITPHSQRGYEKTLVHLESLWVAGDDHQFLAGCLRMLDDYEFREKLAKRGQNQVAECFSFEHMQRSVSAAIEEATDRFPEGVQIRC